MKPWSFALVVLALPAPILACSFCPGSIKEQNTLGEEMDRARLVLFGRAVSSALDPGSTLGKTDFRIDKILRDDAVLKDKKSVVLERYVPVLDAKDPPRFVVFCDVVKDRLDPYLGRSVRSEAVVEYLEGARARLRTKKEPADRVKTLAYYFRYFEHDDETIAGDAFREFAKASDQEVSAAAKHLDADRLRAMMDNPRTNPEYLGLLGFLLGNAGRERDAGYLRTLAVKKGDANHPSFDGLLSGYLSLKPVDGWGLLRSYIVDAKKPFPTRFSAICAMRFCHALKPTEYRQHALKTLELMVPDADVADMAIEDLRKWKLWDLTGSVLAQYGKKSHDAPITKRAIVRYALSCPQPEAKQFVERVRQRDAELVSEIQMSLDDTK